MDLVRTSKVGGHIIDILGERKFDITRVPGLREEIKEFSFKSGREKGWTDLSIDERMERIGNSFGERVLTMLHFARFGIYRHASEIIHGALFGAAFMLGMTKPDGWPQSTEEVKEFGLSHLFLVIFSVILCGCALITCLDQRYALPDLAKKSEELLNQMLRAFKGFRKQENSDT